MHTRVHEQKALICIVVTVDVCGYNGQLKYTICAVCRTCHSILSILKPVFHQLRQILVVTTDGQTDCFTPAHVRGVISRDGRAKKYTNKSGRDNNRRDASLHPISLK